MIPILAFFGLDKNRQADTMTLEFWMRPDEKADKNGATFIGELFIPFKKCFLPEHQNQWQHS